MTREKILRARARKIKHSTKPYPNRKFWSSDGLIDWSNDTMVRLWARVGCFIVDAADRSIEQARRQGSDLVDRPDGLFLAFDVGAADERDIKIIRHWWRDARDLPLENGGIELAYVREKDVHDWMRGLPVPHWVVTAPLAGEVLWLQFGLPNCEINVIRLRASFEAMPRQEAAWALH